MALGRVTRTGFKRASAVTRSGRREIPMPARRRSQANGRALWCRPHKADAVRCHIFPANQRRRRQISIRSCKGITSSSQAITATARNSSPLAKCIVLIETCPLVVSTFSSRTLNGNPEFLTASRARGNSAGSERKFRTRAGRGRPWHSQKSNDSPRQSLHAEFLNLRIFGAGPLNTETVSPRSSVFPSASDTSGASKRSACIRIWCDVR